MRRRLLLTLAVISMGACVSGACAYCQCVRTASQRRAGGDLQWSIHIPTELVFLTGPNQVPPQRNRTLLRCLGTTNQAPVLLADILIGSSQTWQALLYAAITISIVLTVAAEQVAHRDMQKELQRTQPMDSSDELR